MLASARWEIRYSANEKPGTPYYYRISDGHCQWERPKERGVCIVTASDDNTARVWQLSDGYCLCTLEGHTNLVRSVAVSPDGEYVATASWDTTALACGTNGKCIRTLGGAHGLCELGGGEPGRHARCDGVERQDGTRVAAVRRDLPAHAEGTHEAGALGGGEPGRRARGDGVARHNGARVADIRRGGPPQPGWPHGRGVVRSGEPRRRARHHGVARQDRAGVVAVWRAAPRVEGAHVR